MNAHDASSYRIMVFSWNTESVKLCETMDPETAQYNRTSYSTYIPGMTTWRYDCNITDFYPRFSQFIRVNSPDIVVIGFQEDRYPGSYFHSHLLPREMPQIGYDLVKRTKLMGIGRTTYKGIFGGDLFKRGIRVSIYAKHSLIPIIEKEEAEMRKVIGNDGQDEYVCSSITRGKGATVSYLMLPGFGRLAFICCHLPFNANSLITERSYNNRMIRQNELNASNVCFNKIVENLVLFRTPVPTHVIYFGDFNYRLADPRSASEVADEFIMKAYDSTFINRIYMEFDELKEQMRRQNIYEFSEGINNEGPGFLPTCKMVKKSNIQTKYHNPHMTRLNSGKYPLFNPSRQSMLITSAETSTPSWSARIDDRESANLSTNQFGAKDSDEYFRTNTDTTWEDKINIGGFFRSGLDKIYNLSENKSIFGSTDESNYDMYAKITQPLVGLSHFSTKLKSAADIRSAQQISKKTNDSYLGGYNVWKTGKEDQRVPSWCDRILYCKFGGPKQDNHNLICTYYDSFDVGEIMSKSDHAGVLSIFELT